MEFCVAIQKGGRSLWGNMKKIKWKKQSEEQYEGSTSIYTSLYLISFYF